MKSNKDPEEIKKLTLTELFLKLKVDKDKFPKKIYSNSVVEPHIPSVNIAKIPSWKDLVYDVNEKRFENIEKSPKVLSNVKI